MRAAAIEARSKERNQALKARNRAGITAGLLALGLVVCGFIAWAAPVPPGGSGGQAAGAAEAESLEAILDDLAAYDFAVGVGAPMRLHTYVLAHKDDPAARKATESRLLVFLESEASPGGKMEACRSLRLIGSAASAPVLGKLLLDPGTADLARYALERIPGPEAERALLAALDKTRGEVRLGIVFSLGERSAAAVPALERLARSKDRTLAAAAIQALGRIGGEATSNALAALAGRGPSGPLRSAILSARLAVAEGFLRNGRRAEAAALFDQVLSSDPAPILRQAAFKGQIAAAGSGAEGLILGALSGSDSLLHEPAIAMIPNVFNQDAITKVTLFLSELPEAGKIQLLAVLAGYPPSRVARDIAALCESDSAAVRLEALRCLGKAGNGAIVGLLARRAARTSGAEQAAARESLWRLKGTDVDDAVLENLETADDAALQIELVRAIGQRRIIRAKPVLIGIIKDGPAPVRIRAVRAFRDLASQADVETMLDLLSHLEEDAAREEMQNAVAAAARTNPRELARANEVEIMFGRERDPRTKADLLRVLGKIGDDTALPLVRGALESSDPAVADAAVRALADWPTVTPRDDLLQIARTTMALNHRVLAIRAYARMIALEPYRAPEGVVEDLLKVLSLNPRTEEKRLVLGLLARFPCVGALKVAESLIPDEDVREEAVIAADRIREALTAKK